METARKEEAIESAFRSTLRYLKVNAKLEKEQYERQLHRLLKQLYHAAPGDKKEYYKEIQEYLEERKSSPDAHWPGLEEISYWIESRISNQSMIQIIKRKNNR